ncbi:MAG: helix-turn-helix domain-containing protein [Planctomycetes bacterium]|nr:helix-turn-helix domain-containing protein [Planctomycetota bacterium]
MRLDEFLTVKEADEFLGVSPNTVRNWGCEDKIPEHRQGSMTFDLHIGICYSGRETPT